MKTEVQDKIKIMPLEDCIEALPKEKLEELYESSLKTLNEKKANRVTKEEKIEYIYNYLVAKYTLALIFLKEEELKEIEDIINEKKIEKISPRIFEENFIFKVEDEYLVSEELKEMIKHGDLKETNNNKKELMIYYYIMCNGLIKVDKLVELMKESGYKITKKEMLDFTKKNDIKVKDNIIYANAIAEILNEDNSLLEIKELNEYKVMTLEDTLYTAVITNEITSSKVIEKALKNKVKKKKDLEKLADIITTLICVDEDFYEYVDEVLEEYNVNLTEEELYDLYDTLEDICHMIPSWSLNGYAPHDFCSEEDANLGFDDLSEEDKKELYIIGYITINGVIEIDKLVEILTNDHKLKTNKKEVIKIVKNNNIDNEITIIDNYICYTDFSKEMLNWILSLKKFDKYKIIDDMDELTDHININNRKTDIICEDYQVEEDTADEIKTMMLFGILTEETMSSAFENSKKPLSEKKQRALYKELKSTIRNTRMWILNGFMPVELENTIKKEKIGRNEKCPCGSGKKYKHCCGK